MPSLCSVASKESKYSGFIYGVVLCGCRKSFTVHNHSADFIFWPLRITEFTLSFLKIDFRLSRC